MSLSDELIYGEDYAKKMEFFIAELNKIEEENINFFKNRKPYARNEKEDKLCYHYIITTDNNRRTHFSFKDNDLPDSITRKCLEVFKNIFDEKNDANEAI